jgi:hypothetical protein
MESELAKYFGTLGVGGAIAGLIFYFYRKDVKQYTDLWKNVTNELIGVVKDNTASNIKLIVLLENQERNSIRKTDIFELKEALMSRRRDESSNGESDPREVGTSKET